MTCCAITQYRHKMDSLMLFEKFYQEIQTKFRVFICSLHIDNAREFFPDNFRSL